LRKPPRFKPPRFSSKNPWYPPDLYFHLYMPNLKAILVPNAFYHVYNSAVGNEQLFPCEENYLYFLSLYRKYIWPIADTFSYCLTPTSFEFFVRIKDEFSLWTRMINLEYKHADDEEKTHEFLLQQFSNFLNAYTKAFNKMHRRNGRLSLESFKRRALSAYESFSKLIQDMHTLPVKKRLCKRVCDWPHCSYNSILNENHKWIDSTPALQWFGSREEYIQCHYL
jgi:putative transposase